MNKIFLFSSFILVSIFQLNAQVVSIPDANFKSVLLANPAINTNGDNEIQVAEASSYIGPVIANSQNISDLTGIEAFTQIETLVCSENQITSINLNSNTALSTLICSNNQLTSLDVSSNTALTALLCDNNQLASLDLSNNTALTELNCSNNQLSSLDLSTNTALTKVRCSHNQIATLNLSNTQNLQNLHCDNNALSSLNLNDCVSLASLYCDSNQISSLDFSTVGPIQHIQCSSNDLTTLNLGSMPVLEYIDCSHNQLSALDISGVGTNYLQYLNCNDNQIISLDASNNAGLINIFCSQNQLTSINIDGLTDLDSLNCADNQLTSIDLNSNSSLTALFCMENQLTLLDLSLNSYLTDLDCQNNNLDSLNVANGNNTNVQVFLATGNSNLECIFVDDADYSTLNWTNIDPGVGFSDGNPSVGIDTHITCNSLTWIDGNTYTNDNNTATYKINCDSIVTLDLTIENINTAVTNQDNILTATESAQGTTYQWIDCQNNNMPISGATEQTFEPTENGEYAVIVTSQNSCSDTSSCHVINTLDIQNNPLLDKQITLYPNPTSDKINVQTDLDITEVYLLDLQGKQLQTSNLKEVDLSKLSSGIYLIKVKLKNNEIWTSKVIKN